MDGTGGDGAENVVRLPREWVGPPEELVPMGSRARARKTDGSELDGSGSDRDGSGLLANDAIPAADDFWGEGAAAMHGAIQPSGGRAEPAARTERAERTEPAGRRVPRTAPFPHRGPRRGTKPIARRPWGVAGEVRSRAPRPRPKLRPRTVAATVGVACLLAAAGVGLAEGGGHPSTGKHATGARVVATGSSPAHQIGNQPATAGATIHSTAGHHARTGRRGGTSNDRAADQAAARHKAARARRRHLSRRKAARRRHHRHAVVTSGSAGTGSPISTQTTTTPTPPAQTDSASSKPTQGSGSSTRAFGDGGILGAGHQG